jgi:hypothetical protein
MASGHMLSSSPESTIREATKVRADRFTEVEFEA